MDKLLWTIKMGVRNLGSFVIAGWCNCCKTPTIFVVRGENLREDLFCLRCHSFNRQRQIKYIFDRESKVYPRPLTEIVVWNTENSRALHESLKKLPFRNYISSDYIGQDIESGVVVNGVRHEDICNSSFPSEYFDFVLSSDVLEHVPEPERAFSEIYRVLKPGGMHITVPFIESMTHSEIRAIENSQGLIEYLKDAIYQEDPLRRNGILVYTIFCEDLREMLSHGTAISKKCFQ
jgi:hypothetical protein